MNKIVSVNDAQLRIKEYNGQRVVTFKDIDTVHGRVEGTAHRNFKANKDHLVDGKDYFKIQGDEFRPFGINSPYGGYVLTESGYLMLVKSFTDDLAWQVQRQLVSTYFHHSKKQDLPEKADEPYRYIEKRWNGQVVATVKDLHDIWKPLSRYAIRYNVKQYLNPGTDYFHLTGKDLAQFKEDCNNDKTVKLANELFVVTYRGIKRLAKLLCNGDFESIQKFDVPALPQPNTNIAVTIERTAQPKEQQYIESIQAKMTTLSELLRLINSACNETEKSAYAQALTSVSGNLYSECVKLINS